MMQALHRSFEADEPGSGLRLHAAGSATPDNAAEKKSRAFRPKEGALQSWMLRLSLLVLWAIIALLSWAPGAAGEEPAAENEGASEVVDMSLEELLNVEITSVSKREEKRSSAPAAIYVLTQEDIRRSAATTIPDLLRTVPGLHVAQQDAGKWSVTARGFTGRFANKLLVLIDGRSIYTPFFSGVYWEANDVMLEDVERIEIIRGPGGTLWGANAVNGVINILTKKAADTQGGLLSVGGGTEHRASSALRYGGKVGELGHYRAFAKYFYTDRGGSFFDDDYGPAGGESNDDWHNGHAGFRMDLDLSPDDRLMIQGGVQAVGTNATYDLPFYTAPLFVRTNTKAELQDYHLLTRWTRTLADDSSLDVQAFWNFSHAEDVTLDEQRHTLDLDSQHRFQAGPRHDILWGAGYRVTSDDFDNSQFTSMTPEKRTDHLFSAFIQDEIEILDTLHLTIGTKIEHNDYTGIEIQPSARIAWSPNEKHTLWAAVSRAVRTPNRAENDIRLNYGEAEGFPGIFASAFGNPNLKSEELLSYELGYRTKPTERVGLDIALFYNDYNHAHTIEILDFVTETTPPPSHSLVPLLLTSDAEVETYGFEFGADFSVKPWWIIRSSYSYIRVIDTNPISSTGAEQTPSNVFSLQNRFDLPHNLEFDTTLRYVDHVPLVDIPSYVELDARLSWRPRENLEISLIGQNLFDSEHAEYDDTITLSVPTRIQRGVAGKITWRF